MKDKPDEIEDYANVKVWLEGWLEFYGEKWTDVIYHNMTEDQLSNEWCDDVQRIYMWTTDGVYFQCDGEDYGLFMDRVDRDPPYRLGK